MKVTIDIPLKNIFYKAIFDKNSNFLTVTGYYAPFVRETELEPSEGGCFDEITSILLNGEIEIIDYVDKLSVGSKTLYDLIEEEANNIVFEELN